MYEYLDSLGIVIEVVHDLDVSHIEHMDANNVTSWAKNFELKS